MTAALRIATRASELALRRARVVAAMLAARNLPSEIVPLRTEGDKRFDELVTIGGANRAFTRELETAVLRKRADIAVHAFTDVDTTPVPGLAIAAVLRRDDPRDVLVVNELIEARTLAELPRGSRVGSSNVRCRSLLRALFVELEVVHLRGDLPTRLRKVDEGQVHATIVPAAALQTLEISQRIAGIIDSGGWLPSPAQGAVALQIRDEDATTRELVRALDDGPSHTDTAAERACLAALEGGAQSPIGALVMRATGERTLHGVIVDLDGRTLLRARVQMDDASPELVGVRLANELRALGASRILDSLRGGERVAAPQPDQ